MSILITNIKQLLQVHDHNVTILKGNDMKTLSVLENAYVYMEHDTIIEYGEMKYCEGIDGVILTHILFTLVIEPPNL
jgi:imidazolonepropionase